jgi:hypothetical protein
VILIFTNVSTNIIPDRTNTRDIGSVSKFFNKLYVKDLAVSGIVSGIVDNLNYVPSPVSSYSFNTQNLTSVGNLSLINDFYVGGNIIPSTLDGTTHVGSTLYPFGTGYFSNLNVATSVTLPSSCITNTMLSGSIADTKLSTISTSGKISNSATTATSYEN